MTSSSGNNVCNLNCEHCNGPGDNHVGDKCCWSTAMEIKNFRERVKHKYILEVLFDMVISTTSVVTDIIALVMYCYKRKYSFALLTAIPVLLPTFVFTNVYLADDEDTTKKQASRVVSVIGGGGEKSRSGSLTGETSNKKKAEQGADDMEYGSKFDSESTDSSIRPGYDKASRCRQACSFHWSCLKKAVTAWKSCFSGCFQCFCNRDYNLRRKGALAVKNSLQRMFKYGFGTFVLRIIAWMWYVKALIFGFKAYREPKKFMHIARPETHWSYELLVRLDFLQAGLENAPQCVIQLYALITQSDENVALAVLTLVFSFIDFIRVSVSVQWDMHKGPVTAPSGCYKTLLWKTMNTSSWVLLYTARSAAIALVLATSGVSTMQLQVLFPAMVFAFHIVLFGKLLSAADYGVAAQKIVVAVFISLFFLPELDSSVTFQIIQLYYASVIIQNSFFIMPWNGFDKGYCITSGGIKENQKSTPMPHSSTVPITSSPTTRFTRATVEPPRTITIGNILGITPPPPPVTPELTHECLIDPSYISLAVPTMTILGVIFRLLASQKMRRHVEKLPQKAFERHKTQDKLEASITKLFSKNWTQMTVKQMLHAFLRMLKKEVIIIEKGSSNEVGGIKGSLDHEGLPTANKRFSVLGARLQADLLASHTFIRESFSLMMRSTRSHDVNIGQLVEKAGDKEDTPPPEYNSDSELTFRSRNPKKRPRISRSRNVSESNEIVAPPDTTFVQVDFPNNGSQFLEMCWI